MPALSLSFYEFFENGANKDPGKVEDDGSAQGVEDWADGGLLHEQEEGSEVACAKSSEVDNHPRNKKTCLSSSQRGRRG